MVALADGIKWSIILQLEKLPSLTTLGPNVLYAIGCVSLKVTELSLVEAAILARCMNASNLSRRIQKDRGNNTIGDYEDF